MSIQVQLKKYLKTIIKEQPVSLEAEVAMEALEYGCQDITSFFSDLLSHGCQSGMIGKLIYYADTHTFYDKYYYDIEEIRCDLEDSFGEPLQPQGDLKNWYAWLAFEETARKIGDKFELNW